MRIIVLLFAFFIRIHFIRMFNMKIAKKLRMS